MIKIYTLSHPVTSEIRYVGKTKYSLEIRLRKHLVTKEVNYRGNWIRSLIKLNLKPKIELLDEVEEYNWQYIEKYWIAQLKTWGFRLINLTEGGETGIVSKQCRENCIKTNTGRKQSLEEIKKRIANSQKSVYVYDLNINFLNKYISASEAGRKENACLSHITECCNKIRKTHKNKIWSYEEIKKEC